MEEAATSQVSVVSPPLVNTRRAAPGSRATSCTWPGVEGGGRHRGGGGGGGGGGEGTVVAPCSTLDQRAADMVSRERGRDWCRSTTASHQYTHTCRTKVTWHLITWTLRHLITWTLDHLIT